MGKEVKQCMELIMCERYKRWLIISKEEGGFSFRKLGKKSMNVVYLC